MGFAGRMRKLGKMARPQGPGRYEFEPVSWKASRRLKGVQGPAEDREGILVFVETPPGLDAARLGYPPRMRGFLRRRAGGDTG